MKKKVYKPKTVVRNLEKDYGLDADINVEFWANPSQNVILDLMTFISAARNGTSDEWDDEEVKKNNDRYFTCISLIIVDTDIEGLDFSTPQAAEESFGADFVPWGIFHLAVLMYVSELTEEYGQLKNLLRRVEMLSDSGTSEKQQANGSAPTSTKKSKQESPTE